MTNPPLDAIREELVTSLSSATVGPEGNLLEPTPASCRQVVLPFPVIDNDELAKLIHIDEDGDLPGFGAGHSRAVPGRRGGSLGRAAARTVCREARERRSRPANASWCCLTATPISSARPIPSLLLTSAVHHHLIREKTRTKVGLIVETGDAREVHHMALLVGYGAAPSTRTSRSRRSRT